MTKERPKVSSEGQKELDKAQDQFDKYDEQVKSLTLDQMNKAPKQDVEPQTKIAERDMSKMNDVYLKPIRTISSKERFNERFREAYDFDKEYVHFIAENREVLGETIELWTKPYPGLPAENWKVPVNKPLWGPRYLAEQIKRKSYHRLRMDETKGAGSDSAGQYYGQFVVDEVINRLDARPVSTRKSVFMGALTYQ